MEDYIVSARKYRPATFDTVVGQGALTATLKNAIMQGKLANTYLFCGPRGVGKTTCARIFAKTINCQNPGPDGEACGECESCRSFNAELRSYNVFELDAASNNSVDDIRTLTEQVRIPPMNGKYKVYIIDEVHMLSTAAFNAFLKTLEEPPSHAIFVLATTEKHKIPATILSRCQTYDFNRMDVPQTIAHLKFVAEKEGITYEEDALGLIAQKADGGMRDALSIFDQVASFASGNITYQKVIEDLNILDYDYYFRLTEQCLAADVKGCMLTLDEVLARGFQANHFMSGLASHFRSLLVARDPQTLHLLEGSDNLRQRYAEQARKCPPRMLYNALRLCNQCDINYRQSNNKRLLVELTLIQVAQLSDTSAGDNAPGSGLGPTKILKPIFQALLNTAAAQTAATTTSSPTPPDTSAPQTATPPAQQVTPQQQTTPTPQAPGIATTSVAKATTGKASTQGRRTISITRTQQPAQPTPENTPAEAPVIQQPEETHNTPFNAEHFSYQWLRFANSLPIEQIANAERMKAMRPVVNEGSSAVKVTVENERVKYYMERLLPDLLQYLCSELNNSSITIEFIVDESQTGARLTSPHDILNNMRQSNSEVDQFIKDLQLELA